MIILIFLSSLQLPLKGVVTLLSVNGGLLGYQLYASGIRPSSPFLEHPGYMHSTAQMKNCTRQITGRPSKRAYINYVNPVETEECD